MLRSIHKGAGQPPARSSPLSKQVDVSKVQEEGDEEDEAADDLGALPSSSSSSSSSMPPPPLLPRSKGGDRSSRRAQDDDAFSPLSADDCFQEALEVDVPQRGKFRVYFTPPRPKQAQQSTAPTAAAPRPPMTTVPAPADPALASMRLPVTNDDEEEDDDSAPSSSSSSSSSSNNPGTLIFFHHGAGFSALSFALTARAVTQSTNGEVGVLALDCRGHGRTTAASIDKDEGDAAQDMSLSSLTADSLALLRTLYPPGNPTPTLILVGHSMGGSIVTSLCPRLQSASFRIAGVVVLDVVEGTALDALQGMESIIARQPKGFGSMKEAIKWHVDKGTGASIRNLESARRSVPGLLKENPEYVETGEDESEREDDGEAVEELKDGGDDGDGLTTSSSHQPRLIWRHSLLSTTPHWRGWFTGLSQRFLSVRTARLLILAGTDRLDKDLMVGQMQGKYQLQVLPEAGHCVMEDEPEKVAKLIVEFWRRNEGVGVRLPVKMGGGGAVPVRKVGQ